MTQRQRRGTERLAGEFGWPGYLKCIGMGGRLVATQARLLTGLPDGPGQTPSQTRTRLERALADGRIDGAGYRMRMDAVDRLAVMWDHGTQTHVAETDSVGGWREMGDGCHERIAHIYGKGR